MTSRIPQENGWTNCETENEKHAESRKHCMDYVNLVANGTGSWMKN